MDFFQASSNNNPKIFKSKIRIREPSGEFISFQIPIALDWILAVVSVSGVSSGIEVSALVAACFY